MHKRFDHQAIEKKWQKSWTDSGVYSTTENETKPKVFVLDMFPYPSGDGLHVGHPKGYIATDIYSRFKRMTGHTVLHPMGWDGFGLPAENFAIKHKIHPRAAVEKNIARFKEQLEVLGLDYDWDREINTTDPEYYKWTQWIFIQLFKKGLAYESNEPINWCPGCQTGLANEDVENDGTCERCGSTVEKRPIRQWVLKIREYADRMLADLETLQWPEHIKEAQRNWIGRSQGAELSFELHFTHQPEANENRGPNGEKAALTVFTTRPDTLYGATYLVLAPEHPWVTLATDATHHVLENKEEVLAYVRKAKQKNDIERGDNTREKTGVELKGIKAINPANGEQISIFVADYVLGGYGTGAIMAVPAHDERDYAFAKKFDLPIRRVVEPLFIQQDGGNAFRANDPVEPRNAVCVVVRNPASNTFLALEWKKDLMHGLVTGGIDDGEDLVEAARREVTEETGYKNLTVVRDQDFSIHCKFWHRVKEVNRHARFTYVFFELENEECEPVSESERALHEAQWVPEAELASFFTVFEAEFVVTLLTNPDYIHTGNGLLAHSSEFDGMDSEAAKVAITEKVGGKMTNTYRLQDWVFSRQRYWGEPIPIIHCATCGPVAVPESELPVTLPEVEHYEPTGTGESPLANIPEWVNTLCPTCDGPGKRETNTMPQWAGSSWYYLRYMDPKNDQALVGKEQEKYWAPVDVYVGGDHAVRHLIYARFWHKFLYDIGVTSTIEPFQRLEFLGFILAEDGRKMSKRWGNVINPDDIVQLVGADTLRVYEMFMGPFENTIAWSQNGLVGARRFLERVSGLGDHVIAEDSKDTARLLHKTIKKVSEDIETFKFNTAVSAMMIFVNQAEKSGLAKDSYHAFLRLLAPFAPHLTEELWDETDQSGSIHTAAYPTYDEALATDDAVTIGVQINGKHRGEITLPITATEGEAWEVLMGIHELSNRVTDKSIKKIIYVPGRILNVILDE